MPPLKKYLFLVFLWGLTGLCTLAAQDRLERISITERSDGNGYVIRYHMTEMVDSYDLIQPEPNRIQMQLFSEDLDAEGIQMPELNDEITGLDVVPIEGGIGIDIKSSGSAFFRAEAYPDQNLRDLLLTLQYATEPEIEELTSKSELYNWSVTGQERLSEEDEEIADETEDETGEETDNVLRVRRSGPRVSFGLAGGVGIANKVGGSYNSDPRKGMTMGVTATIDVPVRLLPSTNTAIETGLFYTEKGFQNPTSEKINAQTIVLDYIEVPVLAKVSYDFTEMTKPYVVGGFYTAFRTAAETVLDDGGRNDLAGVTSNIDVGLMGGVGTDFVVEKTTVSLQVRYGVGIPPMFEEGYSGGERPGYLSLLVGLRF